MSTTTNPITREVIEQAIDGIDGLVYSARMRTDYIGRGMTTPCVGIAYGEHSDLLAIGASIAYVIASQYSDPDDGIEAIDDAIRPLHSARIDGMGMDYIVYWPAVKP